MTSWTPTSQLAKAVQLAGFLYDPDQDIIYSEMYPVQRMLGYAYGYDLAALGMSADIHCEPIFFEYDDALWMIELWKGQYGLETGCEVGVYVRPNDAPVYYRVLDQVIGQRPVDPDPTHGKFFQCATDDQLLRIQYVLKKNDVPLFTRGPEPHWWLTGFKWGVYSLPEDLTMDVTIWARDDVMGDALEQALIGMGYRPTRNGTEISFEFAAPHAPQPPKPQPALDLVHAADEAIVASYQALQLPNNDPNQLTGASVNEIVEYVARRMPSFAGTVLGEALENAGEEGVSFLVGELNCALSTAAQWFANLDVTLASWISSIYDALHEMFTMNFSCGVEIVNVSPTDGPAAPLLSLVDTNILHKTFGTCGSWYVVPPKVILPGTTARIYLKDNWGAEGAEGWADYAYVDESGATQQVRFLFGCPTGFSSNYASGGPYATYARSGDSESWSTHVPSSGYPLNVAFAWANGPAPSS